MGSRCTSSIALPRHMPISTTLSKSSTNVIPRAHHIGVVHTMFCGAEGDPGFSVAVLSGVNGKFHLGPPIHDVMSHEFGHELGLGHDGFQPHNCPIYNSIMNYTYIVGAGHRLDLAVIRRERSLRWCSTSGTSRSGCRSR